MACRFKLPMSDDLITIATLNHPAEVAHAREVLESGGIPFQINQGDHSQGGPYRIQVSSVDAQAGLDLLEHNPFEPDAHAVFDPARYRALRKSRADREEKPVSKRSENADRAFRASVISLIIPFLFPYAYFMLLQVIFSKEKLENKSRRRAYLAGFIDLLPILAIVFLFFGPFLPRPNPDLRDFPHPEEMAGNWILKSDQGQSLLELRLLTDGRAHYLDPEIEFKGFWGLGHWELQLFCQRILKGDRSWEGKFISFHLDHFNEGEIVLRQGKQQLRLVPK